MSITMDKVYGFLIGLLLMALVVVTLICYVCCEPKTARTVRYDGHEYVDFGLQRGVVHSPDCPCGNGKKHDNE